MLQEIPILSPNTKIPLVFFNFFVRWLDRLGTCSIIYLQRRHFCDFRFAFPAYQATFEKEIWESKFFFLEVVRYAGKQTGSNKVVPF